MKFILYSVVGLVTLAVVVPAMAITCVATKGGVVYQPKQEDSTDLSITLESQKMAWISYGSENITIDILRPANVAEKRKAVRDSDADMATVSTVSATFWFTGTANEVNLISDGYRITCKK